MYFQLFEKFNENARSRGRLLQFQNIEYGYVRVEPRHGVDYIFDIVLLFKKFRPPHRTTLSVRRHVYVQQTFGPIEAIYHENLVKRLKLRSNFWKKNVKESWSHSLTTSNKVPVQPPNKDVYIIMTLKGRAEIFQRFITNLKNILPIYEKSIKLIVVLFR